MTAKRIQRLAVQHTAFWRSYNATGFSVLRELRAVQLAHLMICNTDSQGQVNAAPVPTVLYTSLESNVVPTCHSGHTVALFVLHGCCDKGGEGNVRFLFLSCVEGACKEMFD